MSLLIIDWVYPGIVIASWIAVTGFTLSDLATVAPSLRSIAAPRRPGSLPADELHEGNCLAALVSHRRPIHSRGNAVPLSGVRTPDGIHFGAAAKESE